MIILIIIAGVTILGTGIFVWYHVSAYGFWALTGRILAGHHHTGRHFTNRTMWSDSNGKVVGTPRYTIRPRHHRALYKNICLNVGLVVAVGATIYGLIVSFTLTVIAASLAILSFLGWKIAQGIRHARKLHRDRGIVAPLAKSLAPIAGVSEKEMQGSIKLSPDYLTIKKGTLGKVHFPDTFRADDGEKEEIEGLVNRRLPVPISLKWTAPKDGKLQFASIQAAPPLPKVVLFRDHLEAIRACGPGEYMMGMPGGGTLLKMSHKGESVHKGHSWNTGRGKSSMLLMIGVQLLANEPGAQIWGVDTKRKSLAPLIGEPGVRLACNPADMGEMWQLIEDLYTEMRHRYEVLEKDPTAIDSFKSIYFFGDEFGDFANQIRVYWMNERREKGQPATPPIWYTLASILFQGREVKVGLSHIVMQIMSDKAVGGIGLRPMFSAVSLSGYKVNIWRNVVGTTPVPVVQEGVGRAILVDSGGREIWFQTLYDDEQYLVNYLRERRAEQAKKVQKERTKVQ